MANIKKLPQNVINQIAAGEVVERPASIVKELVENSIDAKATRIIVRIENAGKKLIEIIDNGVGMDKEDAVKAFEQHATSKITSTEDLGNIQTMGFRGEALASISSVSKVSLYTRPRNGSESIKVVAEAEKVDLAEESGAEEGARIVVENLFDFIPARKKFLKGDYTEFNHISNTFIDLALTRTDIHFELYHNGKEIFNLPTTTELKQRIFDLFGDVTASNLIDVHYNSPVLQISGLIGHPSVSQHFKDKQYVFLNNRPIQERTVNKAVQVGFNTFIAKDQYPIFFLYITIDPKKVDVNVHPRKQEVKFEDSQQIFGAVKRTVEEALQRSMKDELSRKIGETNITRNSFSGFEPSSKSEGFKPSPSLSNTNSGTTYVKPLPPSIQQSLNFSKMVLSESERSDPFNSEELSAETNDFSQVFDTYLIFDKQDKLFIMDQHAAAERINYEKLMEKHNLGENSEVQSLLAPVVIDLNLGQAETFKTYIEELGKLGFEIEEFGTNSFQVTSIPALLKDINIENLMRETVLMLSSDISSSDAIEEVTHKIIATLACHGSIRAGMKLSKEQGLYLINELKKCKNTYSCPHGRPIVWELTRTELEKKFKRDYA